MSSTTKRAIAALGASALLAGCGGGGAAVPPVAPAAAAPADSGALANPSVYAPSTNPSAVQAVVAGTKGNANSVSAQLPAAPKPGSLLVAFIGNGDTSTTTTAPSGWTAAADAAGHACQEMDGPAGTQGAQVFTHRVNGQEPAASYTFTFTSKAPAPYAIAVVEIRNANLTTPIDTCRGNNPAKQTVTAQLPAAPLQASSAGELPLVGYVPSTSGLTAAPPAGWANLVYNNAQTPWLTLDVEAGPATAATGSTVTPATTLGNLHGAAIVFAPSVDMLILGPGFPQHVPSPAPSANPSTAPSAMPTGAPSAKPTAAPSTIPTAAPSAKPTAAPSAKPTAAPSATPVPTPPPPTVLRNGVEWPTGFRPFGASSPWNRPMSNTTNPRLLPNSDAMVALAEQGGSDAQLSTSEYGAGYDYSHPVVVAAASDPLVTPHCTMYCSPAGLTQPIHIPAQARPTSGSDHHLSVIQPDGTEIDMWLVSRAGGAGDWRNGDTINYGGGNACGNFYGGSGFVANAATVGGACLGAGIVRASELAGGVIPHALFLVTACMDHAFVYPASQPGDYVCSGGGPHVPNGAHVWLDLSDSAIDALALHPWEKTILHALHQYGAFVGDTKGITPSHTDNLNQIRFESDAQFAAFGAAPAMDAVAKSMGWNAVTIQSSGAGFTSATRYVASDNWQPVNWRQHLHVVDPCYAQGSC